MIRPTHPRFSELESELTRADELSDKDLEKLKSRFSEHLGGEDQDLRAYQQAVREERRRAMREGRSLLERVVQAVSSALGVTGKRRFERRLADAEHALREYDSLCGRLEEEVDEQVALLDGLGAEYIAAQGLFEACQAQYEKRQERVDRLEVRLEERKEEYGGRLSTDVYEVREQLNHARRELRSLGHETNEAMRRYKQVKTHYHAVESLHDQLSDDLVRLDAQGAAFTIKLAEWKSKQLLTFGGSDASLRELYEGLAIKAQEMERFMEENLGEQADEPLDETYAISVGDERPDALVERWIAIRE